MSYKLLPQQIQTMMNNPLLQRKINSRYAYNFKYDIPGFVGISLDSRTIYIDRNLHPLRRADLRLLKKYILTRKALIDLYRLSPVYAQKIAIRNVLLPYFDQYTKIRYIKSPSMKKIPNDLDTSIYHPANANHLNKKIRKIKTRKELLDKANKIVYTKK